MKKKIDKNKLIESGYECISYEAPSNIALIKYWGKVLGQIPMNPSISYTLSECKTTFFLYFKKTETSIENEFFFDGIYAPDFSSKSFKLIELIKKDFQQLGSYHLVLDSSNSFPHSSGIASSASSMCALSFCVLHLLGKSDDLNLVSHYARLGSGSAARSVYGGIVSWGEHSCIKNSSNQYAKEFNDHVHPEMKKICDTVVLVHEGVKEVSSTVGHALMSDHSFREQRISNAKKRFTKLVKAIQEGDFSSWGEIIESEALELHAMMMTSSSSYLLMKPRTLEVIETVRRLRKKYSLDLFFTLDAGPNVHLLYPEKQKEIILELIEKHITDLHFIHDRVGSGPRNLQC